MYLTKKNIEHIDIIGAFMRCPFGEPKSSCPFIKFHQLQNPEKQIEALQELQEDEIQSLRLSHQDCVKVRCQEEKYPEYSAL